MKRIDLCGAWTLESPYGGGLVQVPVALLPSHLSGADVRQQRD